MKKLQNVTIVFVMVTALLFTHMTAFAAYYAGMYAQEELELPSLEFEGEPEIEFEDVLEPSVGIEALSVETVHSWAELSNAINTAPANTPTTILIGSDFSADGGGVVIPQNRDITIESSQIGMVRVLTPHSSQWGGIRHFFVEGTLTLGRGIILCGSSNIIAANFDSTVAAISEIDENELDVLRVEYVSRIETTGLRSELFQEIIPLHIQPTRGGVTVNGGTLTMLSGSVIRNSSSTSGGGVHLMGNGTGVGGRATLNLHGGIIHNNSGSYGGGIVIGDNARVDMTSGTISNNSTFSSGGGVWILGGNNERNGTGFHMTGGSIINNVAGRAGGGIYTHDWSEEETVPESAYASLFIGSDAQFYGNYAGNGASAPPDNTLPHISADAQTSIWHYLLNNRDIVYPRRIGQVPQITRISSPPTNPDFGTHRFGYTQRPFETITITNTGTTYVTMNPLPVIQGWTLDILPNISCRA